MQRVGEELPDRGLLDLPAGIHHHHALRRLGEDGGILPGRRPSPLDGRTLHLADTLFTEDALIWDAVRSRSVRYGAPGKPQLDVAFDAPMLGIWTKPGAHFVCIEPWLGGYYDTSVSASRRSNYGLREEVLRLRGKIPRSVQWDVKVDLFFYRPLIVYAQAKGLVEFLMGRKDWNKFERNVRGPVGERTSEA